MIATTGTELAEAIDLPLERRSPGLVVAFVGAGGKTSALYALASAAAGRGLRVIATTTTHLRDPRLEPGRRFDRLALEPGLAAPAPPSAAGFPDAAAPAHPEPGEVLVLASAILAGEGKIAGLDPGWAGPLSLRCDLLLVEADGARGRSVKAPDSFEPSMPPRVDFAVGLVGLDCLGKPLGPGIAHRPELFGPLVGCGPGEPIGPGHIVALAASPEGLFRRAPAAAGRIILLNKADSAAEADTAALAGLLAAALGPAVRVVVAALGAAGGAAPLARVGAPDGLAGGRR